tara:strand:- start:8228 stop:9607 length:1380 start_codon:yes stop_codon:yes gene_type:complete
MEAVSFDHQRTVNMYPLVSESGTSKDTVALRSCSGLSEFLTIGGGAIRGGIEANGRAFFVSGNEFYEIFDDGTSTLRGKVNTTTGECFFEENPTQIMIIDGEDGYIFTKAANSFVTISDPDFPTASHLTFQDGYFLVTQTDSPKFWISNINNGLAWDALDNTTVESSPDNLVGLISDSSNLWLFGTKSTEVFRNTGASPFPFQVIDGASFEVGCAAQGTIKEIDNAIYWLGSDENGDSIVWRSNGYNAFRVSTQAIEKKISESENFNESSSWVYHERGHAFYALRVKGLNTTLVLDVTTGAWHERVYRNPITADEEQHRGANHIFFDKKHLIGDRETNQVYEMRLDLYDDDGDPMIKRRITPHYSQERALITHAQLELDMEIGVGLVTGQGSDPQIMMRYSDDGGRTWSNELWTSLGKIGEYFTRVKWNKLGVSRDRVYELSVSDPVFVQINAAYLNGK